VARATFAAGVRVPALDLLVEVAADIHPVNPFDFFLDDRCQEAPFPYPEELRPDLRPFLDLEEASVRGGPRLASFLADASRARAHGAAAGRAERGREQAHPLRHP
jgi:hypothetical protein